MKSLLIIAGLLSSIASTTAQIMEWLVPVDLNDPQNGNFSSTRFASDAQGTVMLIGIESAPYNYGSQVFGNLGLRLIDPTGSTVLSATFHGRGLIEDIVEHDGSFFVIGQFKDSLQFPGQPQLLVTDEANNVGSFVCRIEASGEVVWMKDLDELGVAGGVSALDVGDDANLYIAAWDFINSVVVVAAPDGMLLDIWELEGVALISDIAVNAAGTVAIAGSCLSNEVDFNGTPISVLGPYTIFTARFSASGTLQDHLIIRDITCPAPSVELDDENNLYFCADAFIETQVGPFTVQDPTWVHGTFVIRINALGEVLWLKQPTQGATIGDVGRGDGRELILHHDGGVWQGGTVRGSVDWGDGIQSSASIPGSGLYFWRIDGSGTSSRVITSSAPNASQGTHSMATADNGALYVLASSYDTLGLGGVVLPAVGYGLYLSRWSELTTGLGSIVPVRSVKMYPDPAEDQLTIDLSEYSRGVQLEVFDPQGRLVRNLHVGATTFHTIAIGDLNAGVYQVRIHYGAQVERSRFDEGVVLSLEASSDGFQDFTELAPIECLIQKIPQLFDQLEDRRPFVPFAVRIWTNELSQTITVMTALKDKIALITGAGSGIGEAIAQLFAANGAGLVLVDQELKQVQKVKDRIIKSGGKAMALKADVSDPAQCERMVYETMKAHDRLDVAVNNAGIGGPSEPIGNYPIEDWDNVISVNLSGVFYGMRYQIPAMLRKKGGVIVNVSSILGSVGFPNSGAYVAAKHGILGLTKNAALEYATKGIRANAVCPGFVGTHMLEDNMDSQQLKQIAKQHPMQRLGKANEVAELVLWLASEKSSFVTGSSYNVDGGYLAQ